MRERERKGERKMEERRSRWENMETDCLVKVFERLKLEDIAVGAGPVCRSWRKASLSPECWKVLDFQSLVDLSPTSKLASGFSQSDRPQFLKAFMKHAVSCSQGLASKLSLPSGFSANIDDLTHAANECPKLEVLCLPRLASEEDECIPRLIGQWKDLQCLEMAAKPCSFHELLAEMSLNCKNFAEMKICSGCITNEDAAAIVSMLPNIKRLSLGDCYIRKEEMLTVLDGCKKMETFEAVNCVGFSLDEEIRVKAVGVRLDCRGSKPCYGIGWIENDEEYYIGVL